MSFNNCVGSCVYVYPDYNDFSGQNLINYLMFILEYYLLNYCQLIMTSDFARRSEVLR